MATATATRSEAKAEVAAPARTAESVMAALAAPIPGEKIRTRKGSGGRDLAYIQASTVMERLDEAAGPANWWCAIEPAERWVKCSLTVRLPDGSTITREGIGGYPEMPTDEDRSKGGATDSLKRAGVLFGIGRDLYEDMMPDHHAGPARPQPAAAQPGRPPGKWGNGQPTGGGRPSVSQGGQGGGGKDYGPPRSGKGLWAWSKEHGYVDQVNDLARSWGLQGRMVDWDADTVRQVYDAMTGNAAGATTPADDDIPY